MRDEPCEPILSAITPHMTKNFAEVLGPPAVPADSATSKEPSRSQTFTAHEFAEGFRSMDDTLQFSV